MFYIYGFLAITHIVAQMILGHLDYKRQKRKKRIDPSFTPSVAIIVPVYNEDEQTLKHALDSMRWQKYGGNIQVYVVDDGSKNIWQVEGVYKYFEENVGEQFKVLRRNNQGKRKAQVEAINEMARVGYKPDVIVTVDSDTVLTTNAVAQIVQDFADESVGATTGNVLVLNKDENILTKLINYRYWMAFNQERAAQSYFEVLMCCSGPFSAYRGSIFRGVAQKYISQVFFGKVCTYGDDRHLTNLILEQGWGVRYNKDAEAFTHVPNNMRGYLKQQLRWNKSFYREMIWTLKAVTKHHWYLLYDLAMQFVLPFMLIAALVHTFYQAVFVDYMVAVQYLGIIIAVSLLRVSYGLLRTRDLGFFWFLVYGFFHVLVLIPNRLIALATLNDGRWGTRG